MQNLLHQADKTITQQEQLKKVLAMMDSGALSPQAIIAAALTPEQTQALAVVGILKELRSLNANVKELARVMASDK